MTGADELGRTLAAIARSFEALGVRWAVGGSIASAAHGEPRSTNDVNVIATLSVDQARALVEGLHETFYGDQAAAEEAVRRRTSFNLIDQVTFIKVDVLVQRQGRSAAAARGARRRYRTPCAAAPDPRTGRRRAGQSPVVPDGWGGVRLPVAGHPFGSQALGGCSRQGLSRQHRGERGSGRAPRACASRRFTRGVRVTVRVPKASVGFRVRRAAARPVTVIAIGRPGRADSACR